MSQGVSDSDDSFSSMILSSESVPSESETDPVGGKPSRLQMKGGGEEFHLDERVTSAYMLVYVRSDLAGTNLSMGLMNASSQLMNASAQIMNPSSQLMNASSQFLTNPSSQFLTKPLPISFTETPTYSTSTTPTDRFIRLLLRSDLQLRQQDFLDNHSVSLQLHSARAPPANASLFKDQLLTRQRLHQLGVSVGIPANCQDWWLCSTTPTGIRVTRRPTNREWEKVAGEWPGVWRAGRRVLSLYCRNARDANFAAETKHLKTEEFLVFVEVGGKSEDFLVIPAMSVRSFVSRVIDHIGGVKLAI